jgi:hypothetical protein
MALSDETRAYLENLIGGLRTFSATPLSPCPQLFFPFVCRDELGI